MRLRIFALTALATAVFICLLAARSAASGDMTYNTCGVLDWQKAREVANIIGNAPALPATGELNEEEWSRLVNISYMLQRYADQSIEGGLIVFMAESDYFPNSQEEWSRALLTLRMMFDLPAAPMPANLRRYGGHRLMAFEADIASPVRIQGVDNFELQGGIRKGGWFGEPYQPQMEYRELRAEYPYRQLRECVTAESILRYESLARNARLLFAARENED